MPRPTSVQKVNPVRNYSIDLGASLVEAGDLIDASKAREKFSISGEGLTVAVLDTGARTTHEDFKGRIVAQRNFTSDNGGDPFNASDPISGHGTNVTGIIAADGNRYKGIAPRAKIIPIKVLDNFGNGSFDSIVSALKWLIENNKRYKITSVCMSLGDGGNHTSDTNFDGDEITELINKLIENKVMIIAAAGNDFRTHGSNQGMSYPAILRNIISVGAVYDEDEGALGPYNGGALAHSTGPDRITPFSQRLHKNHVGLSIEELATDIFAPGAPITSTGNDNDTGPSVQEGTSQAAPIIAGTVLLIQEFFLRVTGRLPEREEVIEILRIGAENIIDGDDEDDNVIHTNETYQRVNIERSIAKMPRVIHHSVLNEDDNAALGTAGVIEQNEPCISKIFI